jgi:hypothetical protein
MSPSAAFTLPHPVPVVLQTAVKVYRRYITFDPAYREEYTAYLLSIGHFDEGAKQIATMVNDDAFVSLKVR